MKKYSILLGAALGMLALSSCEEAKIANPEMEGVKKSIPFELVAKTPETKTTIDAETWQMDWESGDILYAVTTDSEWGVPYSEDNNAETIAEFVYSGTSFSTDKEISDGEHTFNFLYVDADQKSFHRGTGSTHKLVSSQTMDAKAPTSNLKLYNALIGQVTVETPTDFVGISMNQLYTLMKVTLKNKTGEDMTVSTFEMTAENATLSGIFNVTFGDNSGIAVKTGYGDKITVTIENGTLAADGELPVYFVMAPLNSFSGDITFSVTDSYGVVYTKTNTVSGVTFDAGKYNTASFTLNPIPDECVSLNWLYEGGTSADLNSIAGVTTNGLGSDYAASHGDYRVKFDTEGDFIQVKTDSQIGSVEIGVKLIGGKDEEGNGAISVMESSDGKNYTLVQSLPLKGKQNDILSLSSENAFNSASRYVRFVFNKSVNVGVGPISIYKVSTGNDPSISAEDVTGIAIQGGSFTTNYTLNNWSGDDDVVATCDGTIVTQSSVSNNTVSFTVAPNYTKSAKTGSITLTSASKGVYKTINVSQLASSGMTVSETTITIPSDETSATIMLTTADYGWDAIVSVNEGMNLIVSPTSGNASNDPQSITITSNTPATSSIQTLGTIEVYRNGNTSDSQKKTITVKKAAIVTSGKVTYTVSSTTAVATSGVAPQGSAATYSQTYGTKCQMTAGNSITLTLSGFGGLKITGAEVSVKSNKSGGAGSLSLSSEDNTIAAIQGSAFNTENWNNAWSTSYVTKVLDVTPTTIGSDDTIVLTIAATANSLYFESLTLYYE